MHQFSLLYQPKVQGGLVVSLEALYRPQRQTHSIVEHLSNIEDKTTLDLEVVSQCIQDINQHGIRLPVSIDIYPSSVLNEVFINRVVDLCADYPITLELVEHQNIEPSDLLISNIKALREAGIHISIDNFGQSFTSTDFVFSIDADEVKFDKSVIRDIENNYARYKHLTFLYSKVKFLKTSNIVFEGIENKQQKDLIDVMVDKPIFQGFYFHKPMPMEEVAQLENLKDGALRVEEKPQPSLVEELELEIYNYVINSNDITKPEFNEFVQQHDKLGLVYNLDVEQTLSNLRKTYYSEESIVSNGMLSLIDSTDKLVVIRNEEGVVVYDNTTHIEFMGGSLVAIPPADIVKQEPGYQVCLDRDNDLLTDNDAVYHKAKETFGDTTYDTVREKISFNNRNFVITTVYPPEFTALDLSKDELTQCYKRSYLSSNTLCYKGKMVAFVDINGFKAVNDTYGHKTGDLLLTQLAELLQAGVSESDVVVRYGGDEFILLIESQDEAATRERLDALNQTVTEFFAKHGFRISFAYGLARVENQDIEAAIEAADKEMYRNKHQAHMGVETPII